MQKAFLNNIEEICMIILLDDILVFEDWAKLKIIYKFKHSFLIFKESMKYKVLLQTLQDHSSVQQGLLFLNFTEICTDFSLSQ